MIQPFPSEFYNQNARAVARALLGAKLVSVVNGQRVSGMIVETEAYTGLEDRASHANRGKTPRNLPMWEAPGQAYVYLCRGTHWLLNAVCEPAEQPAAVLLRALEPLEGHEIMQQHRPGQPIKNWTSGPGKLTRALGVTHAHNRLDLTTLQDNLWIEPYLSLPDEQVVTSARVGMGKNLPEPWFSMPWRWCVRGNPYVSVKP